MKLDRTMVALMFNGRSMKKGEALLQLMYRSRAEGEEGIVITKASSFPEPGKRTSRKTLKIKKEIENDIDCFPYWTI